MPNDPSIGKWNSVELGNAKAVIDVAVRRGLGLHAATIGVMTAITESTLQVLSYGDSMGPSSRGLFQQMPPWGPLSVRMDPAGSAGLFYDRMVQVSGWQNELPWYVAQDVQESEFKAGFTGEGSDGTKGWNYQQNWTDALNLVAALAGAGSSTILGADGNPLTGKSQDDSPGTTWDGTGINTTNPTATGSPDGPIGTQIPSGAGGDTTGLASQIAALPKLHQLPSVQVLPFSGAQTVSGQNRLGKVLLGGRGVEADVVSAAVSASMSYSSQQINQFTLVLQDTPDAQLCRSGLIKPGVAMDYADQHTDVRGISIDDGKGAPLITLKGRSRVVSRLKAIQGGGSWGTLTPRQWLADRCREVGATSICQAFAAQQIYRQIDNKPESDWDVIQRLAQELGAIAFEYDQVILFGKPSWLARASAHREWRVSWNSPTEHSSNIDSMPRYSGSADSAESLTFGLVGDFNENIRPGDVVTMFGNLPVANGKWFVTGADMGYSLGQATRVSCARIIDPVPAARNKVAPVAKAPFVPAPPTSGAAGADAKGLAAAQYAMSKVGPPQFYVYAGDGPLGYDCSGLTQQAWLTQGITIPRTSLEQSTLPTVALDQLLPGDLVTYYSPVHHVAMYVGNGNVASAADEELGIILVPTAKGGPNPTGHRVPR